jgi:hypothetical protein
VRIKNQEELTNAMKRMIEDEKMSEKYGVNANKIGLELNTEKINERWYEYIKNILRGK